jgi:hypothetical protein
MKELAGCFRATGCTLWPETTKMGQGTSPLAPQSRRSRDMALELTRAAYAPPVQGDTPAERAVRLRDAASAFAGALDTLAKRLPGSVAMRLAADRTTQVEDRSPEALNKIHDDASLSTLQRINRLICSEGIPLKQVATTQTHLLASMSGFHTRRGLRVMLEWASLSTRREAMKDASDSTWDAECFVRDTLAGSFGNMDEWRKIATELTRDGLSTEERQRLEPAAGKP